MKPSPETKKNVLLLTLCQALVFTGNSAVLTISALTGFALAADKSLATLPLALQYCATTITTIPASFFMKRFGRRAGLILGATFGMIGGGLCALGIFFADFWLFSSGTLFWGIFNGFAMYYRFAAADVAGAEFRSRAVSLVMGGGVVAALAGPALAGWGRDFFPAFLFAGSFGAIAFLPLGSVFLLFFVKIPVPSSEELNLPVRPLLKIVSQPATFVAILGAVVGYSVMAFLMTATPLSMAGFNLSFENTVFAIQWHVFGMFAPSFLTGHLIRRYGVLRIVFFGCLFNLLGVGVNLNGVGLVHFWVSLFLLGLGWNFIFVGSTTLLLETCSGAEKTKIQALNEFLTYGAITIASFSAGNLQFHFGWQVINYGVIPFILLVLLGLWRLRV